MRASMIVSVLYLAALAVSVADGLYLILWR